MTEPQEFAKLFREIQPKFSRLFSRILTHAGLSLPQYALLNQLVGPRGLSMTVVSERLGITKPAVTHLVDRLEKGKYLKRIPHPDDRRVFLLEIQARGEKVVHGTRSRILPILLKALSEFSQTEQKTIARFYGKLSAVLDQVLNRPRSKIR